MAPPRERPASDTASTVHEPVMLAETLAALNVQPGGRYLDPESGYMFDPVTGKYYDPTTGFGHGSDLFSWTAALFLDVVLED